MPVNLNPPDKLLPIAGARLGVADAAVKKPGQPDVALMALAAGTSVACVFTRNAFAAAPVALGRKHIGNHKARALLINSGNANAGTGEAGLVDATQCCEAVAGALAIDAADVLPFSTGVIGHRLPVDRLCRAAGEASDTLDEDGWLAAARAMMTTDVVPKGLSRRMTLADGQVVTLTGIAKGSGMICPDMATMLAFVGTDAAIGGEALQQALDASVADSFNSITVDGDTSTNDACLLFATGQSATLRPGTPDWLVFTTALAEIMQGLAQAVIRDAEGATRFITLDVTGAADTEEARRVAFTVGQSPLVKTACFAGDPNWGRILAAVGRAGVDALDISGVSIHLDDVVIVANGRPAPDYREADAEAVMAQAEFTIAIDLGRGQAGTRIWTSDLSHDYITINAEYRT